MILSDKKYTITIQFHLNTRYMRILYQCIGLQMDLYTITAGANDCSAGCNMIPFEGFKKVVDAVK